MISTPMFTALYTTKKARFEQKSMVPYVEAKFILNYMAGTA
jgi:hypothetical protein